MSVSRERNVVMTETITDADLRVLLDVVEAARTAGEEDEGLPDTALGLLHRLVPCDSLSYCELDPAQRAMYLEHDHPGGQAQGSVPLIESHAAPQPGGEADDAFWHHYDTCLGCSYPTLSGDARSITTMSDFYSQREYRSTGMYTDYLGPLGVEFEAMLCLPAPAARSRRIVLFRSGRADFDGRDRLLLALLRPHLAEVERENRHRAEQKADLLTARQRELLALVAKGHSNVAIARALTISPATVRTHLENIFDRLGVMSRTAAVAKAGLFADVPAPKDDRTTYRRGPAVGDHARVAL